MITGTFLLTLLVWILIIAAIASALVWVVAYVSPQPPFDKIARLVVGIIVIVMVIELVSSMAGHPFIPWR